MTIDAMERIALALEIRTLRAELANGGVRTEDEKATVREAIEARRRRLAAVDIDRPSQAAPGRPARLPDATPGARAGDPGTSHAAAERAERKRTKAQREVLAVFDVADLSGREAEQLPALSHFGPSSVRKRISELAQFGLLEECGLEKGPNGKLTPATVYRLTVAGRRALDEHQAVAP